VLPCDTVPVKSTGRVGQRLICIDHKKSATDIPYRHIIKGKKQSLMHNKFE
jgi:hypothetical protein